MPLRDHFHPPLSRTHPWRSFHGAWASAIARLLNAGGLPPGYYAVPFLDRSGPIEIDVATLSTAAAGEPAEGFQPWTPPEPGLTLAIEWPETDEVRVEILADEGDPALAAAIELVSPDNKDRPSSREAFAAKCADYLRRGCGLVVIDVIPTRRADLHADLLAALDIEAPIAPAGIGATAYRSVAHRLLAWPEAVELGQVLPTVPLWLAAETAVPLDLEASYTTACRDLGIR